MEDWIKDLRYILLPSNRPKQGLEREYEEAFQVWVLAWKKFRTELGVEAPLNSDGFVLPHEMGVIFYKDECVGLSGFTHGTLSHGPVSALSWFNAWTPEAIESLKALSTNVLICSQFTINPKFAGKDHFVRWKDILSLYTLLRFEYSDAEIMAGHLNLTRGMQNAGGETNGATILNPNHPFSFYGVEIPAQLVAYEKKNIQQMIERKEIGSLCEALWSKLEHNTEFSVRENILKFKTAA